MDGPAASILAWAARTVHRTGKVVVSQGMRAGGSPWLLRVEGGGAVTDLVLKTGDAGQRAELCTEAAALQLAERSSLPAPRLMAADLRGEEAGGLALLITKLEGTADIPLVVRPPRLRALGMAAAALHAVPLAPTPDLPKRERHMPWIDFVAMRREGEPSSPLMTAGDDLLQRMPAPEDAPVFVHADLWQGNTMWIDDTYNGMIDFEAAGSGSYGVDLGSLRLDTALLHGMEAADHVLRGWEEAAGHAAENVAYWDAVAALNTRADMTGFLPTIHEAGRTDMNGRRLTERRDAFLRAALESLDGR